MKHLFEQDPGAILQQTDHYTHEGKNDGESTDDRVKKIEENFSKYRNELKMERSLKLTKQIQLTIFFRIHLKVKPVLAAIILIPFSVVEDVFMKNPIQLTIQQI